MAPGNADDDPSANAEPSTDEKGGPNGTNLHGTVESVHIDADARTTFRNGTALNINADAGATRLAQGQ